VPRVLCWWLDISCWNFCVAVCYSVSQCVAVCSWGWVFLRRTQILSRFQFTRHFIEFCCGFETICLAVIQTWSWRCKHVASARACLREANAERSYCVFPNECATCFWYENVEESPTYICAQLWYLPKEYRCGVATSDLKNVFDRKICQDLRMRSSILFASTEVVHRPKSGFPLHFDIRNS